MRGLKREEVRVGKVKMVTCKLAGIVVPCRNERDGSARKGSMLRCRYDGLQDVMVGWKRKEEKVARCANERRGFDK